ncbi:MAG TPA: hypothetical protein VFE42_10610 [Chloroflexota bacterium]|nr:hypothetical protein [Chloroflexota bacterium]
MHNHYTHDAILNQRISDIYRAARQRQLVRLARQPRPLRRRVGLLLIAAGQALVRSPSELELAVPESG